MLDAVDKVLVKLVSHGIKAIISPSRCESTQVREVYHVPLHPNDGDSSMITIEAVMTRTGIPMAAWYFYEQQAAFDAYDNRLTHILNYKGKYSGSGVKDYSKAIMAFELQNEPMLTKTAECLGSSPAGKDWPCGRATHMRSVLEADNRIRIATGGVGGEHKSGLQLYEAGGTMSCYRYHFSSSVRRQRRQQWRP